MRLVHVPEAGDLLSREVRRRHPRAALRQYVGDPPHVSRERRAAVVIYCCDQPPRGPRGVALGMADLRSGVVLVFVRDLRRYLRLRRWDDPRLDVAIGRVIAHELEHLRRGDGAHDRAGWFRRCPDSAYMLGGLA
jgi:hypothetical protein